MQKPHIAAKTVSVKLDADTRTRVEKCEAFRQDTPKAWEEYQETGLHVTASEVDAWLSTWGTEAELSAPVCHK
jgi:predicted transcriptional regulator